MTKKIPDEMKEQIEDTEENENGHLDNTEHELDTEKLELLDPKLIEALEQHNHEDLLVEFDGSKKNGNDERLQIVREWFTPENDYRADTYLEPEQVYALTLLGNIDNMYETLDLEDMQHWIDNVTDDMVRYLVSREGFARKQEENVLRSVFGDNSEMSPADRDSMFMKMLSNPRNGEEKE